MPVFSSLSQLCSFLCCYLCFLCLVLCRLFLCSFVPLSVAFSFCGPMSTGAIPPLKPVPTLELGACCGLDFAGGGCRTVVLHDPLPDGIACLGCSCSQLQTLLKWSSTRVNLNSHVEKVKVQRSQRRPHSHTENRGCRCGCSLQSMPSKKYASCLRR